MELPIVFKKFENDIVEDFYTVLVEDSIRANVPEREAQKQAKKFAGRIPKYDADMLHQLYDLYKKGEHSLAEVHDYAIQLLFQMFCRDNGLAPEAVEYFLTLREELIEAETGFASSIKFTENVLTYYLRGMCYYLHELEPEKDQQAIVDEATAETKKVQEQDESVLPKFYNEYRKGNITLVEATDSALKALLENYLEQKGDNKAKVEQLLGLLMQM